MDNSNFIKIFGVLLIFNFSHLLLAQDDVSSVNISDQYFEDIPNPISLDYQTYKGFSSVTLEVIDIDQDGLKDIVVHFWAGTQDGQKTGITPNFLKVFRLKPDLTFEDFTMSLLGEEKVNLGGASRNIEVADFNDDGKLDVAFNTNQEDGRVDDGSGVSDGQLAVMLSTSEGYEIVKFGTPSWYHSLGIGTLPNGKKFVTGNGFSGNFSAEIFSFSGSNEPILNSSNGLEIPPNAFRFLDNSENISASLIRNGDYPNMFGVIAYELIDNQWIKTDQIDNPYPKLGEVQHKGWNGADYEIVDVLDVGGIPSLGEGGSSYAESCSLKIYPEADPIVVLKLSSAELVGYPDKKVYLSEETAGYSKLIGFKIENSTLYNVSLSINDEQIYENVNFIDCLDVDGDSYQDIVAYAYKRTPLIYINNQRGEFNLLSNNKLPDIEDPLVWPENTAAASIDESSILRDFTGDGIPDLFFWPANGIPAEDFENDFIDGVGLKFFKGKAFLTKNRLDSDDDSFSDEVDAFPLDGSEWLDTDADGVGNNSDMYPENSLYSKDSDSDGMPDAWETKYGLNPNDASDATSDIDNDGVSALDEFLAGTIPSGSIDLDGNEKYDALTDGLLLLRGMFGLDGSALVTGTVASDATYTASVDIESRIATLGDLADIDGNGTIDALTDGLLTLRYLFGLEGDTLIDGVVASDATRTTAVDIEAHLNTLMPAL